MINAYVPHLLEALVPDIAPHEPYRCVELTGVILFVDIVDSTSIVEQLAATGPEGAERLGALFNDYFAYVFDVVGAHGGDVIRIHGDAVLGLWPGDTGGNSAATAAALKAAALLRQGDWLSRETGVAIRHRVLVSSGSMFAMVLRWTDEQSFFLLSGPAVDALKSPDTAAKMEAALARGAPLHPAPPARDTAAAGREADVPARSDACSTLAAFAPPTRHRLPAAIARKFIARMVANRIANAEDGWLAEFRVVSMVYVHLRALQSASVERMDAAVRVIQDTIGVFDIALFDLLVGDKGVVALIACGVPPFARERNAVRALQAARQIRAQLRAIRVDSSIGVATGRAFCGDVGNASRRECLVTGTVMHTGARLMQAADGAILCDSATARAASDHFEFVEPVLLTLKGVPEPVSVYRADTLDEKSHAIPDTAGDTLHGRAEELGRITAAFNDLERGRGAILVVEGEPGAGKSRLLAHVAAEARARQMAFADTATSSVELTTAYYACRCLLKGLLLAPADPPNAGPGLLRQRLMEALGGHALQAKAALLEDVLPLGIEDKGLAKEIPGPARLSGIEELFVHLATRRAGSRASVIVVDDVHWLDDPSARLLLALARRLPRLLLALATRPLDDRAGPNVKRLVQSASVSLALPRLDRAAVRNMLRELLGVRSIPPDFAEFVYGHSEGLPFHAQQLVLSLIDQGVVSASEGRCRVDMSELSARSPPDNLRDLIVSRIDALDPLHQVTAKIASAIGRTFPVPVLEHVFPFESELARLPEILSDLARAGILEPAVTSGVSACAFSHVLIKEATYELLTFEQRQPLHRRIAEFIERSCHGDLEPHYAELADHYEHADDFRKAVEYRHCAALLSIRRYANYDALKHVDRAEALAAQGALGVSQPQAAELARIRADALHELTRFAEAQVCFERCAALSGIPVPRTRVELVARATMEVTRQCLHRLGIMRQPGGPDALQKERLTAHIYTRFAEHAYFTGDALWLVHGTLASLNHAERVGAVAEIIEGYGGLAIGLGTAGLHKLARSYRARAIERAESEGTLHDQGFAHLLACVYSFHAGDWVATPLHCSRGAAICERIGDRFRYQSCRVVEAYMHIVRGQYDTAESILGDFGEDADEVENIPVRAWVLAGRAILDHVRGRSPKLALARLASARDESLHDAERLLCDGLEALAHMEAGDIERAARTADLALANMLRHPPTMGCAYLSIASVIQTYIVLAERAAREGRSYDALLAQARTACRAGRSYAGKTPIFEPRCHLLNGRLAMLEGRTHRARDSWTKAIDTAARHDMPLEQALAGLALAQIAGDTDERRRLEREGCEKLERIGARPWLHAIEPARELYAVTA